MKIGLFTDTFYPEINGVATSCLNLYQQLQKMGQESYRLIQEKYQIENYLEGIETLLAKLGEER